MKTIKTRLLAFGSIALLMLAACKKNDALVTSNGGKPGTLTASTTKPVLDKAKITDATPVISFSFNDANYGFKAAVTNTLQIDPAGDNWKSPMSVTLGTKVLSQSYSTADFNALLLKLNLPGGVTSQVQVRIAHSVSSSITPVYSNVLDLTVTPFNLISYLYVVGNFNGYNASSPDSIFSATGNGIYTGIINFTSAGNRFLILPEKNYNTKYATTDAPNTNVASLSYSTEFVSSGGSDLYAPAAPGYYLITFNSITNTITVAPTDNYSVIGDAAQGWGTDVDMKYINDGSGNWVLTTPLSVELPPNDGYKIRKDHDWGIAFGTPNPANGTQLVTSSGDLNIGNAVAGTYTITFWLNPADATGNTGFWTAVKQ